MRQNREIRQYSKEFKSEAVHLSYQRENIKDLAYELGIQAVISNLTINIYDSIYLILKFVSTTKFIINEKR